MSESLRLTGDDRGRHNACRRSGPATPAGPAWEPGGVSGLRGQPQWLWLHRHESVADTQRHESVADTHRHESVADTHLRVTSPSPTNTHWHGESESITARRGGRARTHTAGSLRAGDAALPPEEPGRPRFRGPSRTARCGPAARAEGPV